MQLKRNMDNRQFKTDITVLGFILLVFGGIYYFGYYGLGQNCKYTIATITDVQGTLNGSPEGEIVYKINGVQYKGIISVNQGNITYKKGDRIYIKFNSNDPDKSSMIYNKLVPDNMNAPSNGWDSIPK